MVSDDEEGKEGEEDEDGEEEEKDVSGAVYRAPKVSATPYEIAEQGAAARQKREEKRLKILQRSRILQEEREEMSSKPRMIRDTLPELEALREEDKERQVYEEKSFQRLMYTKKDKQRRSAVRRQARSSTSFAKLESFGGIESALNATHEDTGVSEDGVTWNAKQARSLAEFEKEASRGRKRGFEGGDDGFTGKRKKSKRSKRY